MTWDPSVVRRPGAGHTDYHPVTVGRARGQQGSLKCRIESRSWEVVLVDLAPAVGEPAPVTRAQLENLIAAMAGHDRFPCLGARSVFRRDNAVVRIYG